MKLYRILVKCTKKISYYLPKKVAHQVTYYLYMHQKLNLQSPKTFDEKLHWLMVYKYGKKEAFFADKYLVKEYVANKHIKGLLIPEIYQIYTQEDQIHLEDLPEKFVLKCNHMCGDIFICQSKKLFDLEHAKKILFKDLKKNFAKHNLEYHYSYIKPVVIAEEYLEENNHVCPVDYKFFCFNGVVDCVSICYNRDTKVQYAFYDRDWNPLPYIQKPCMNETCCMDKPAHYHQMIHIAEQLSADFPFVRVDLYNVNGRIYFGEYTFTPSGGRHGKVITKEAEDHLGSLLNLSKY